MKKFVPQALFAAVVLSVGSIGTTWAMEAGFSDRLGGPEDVLATNAMATRVHLMEKLGNWILTRGDDLRHSLQIFISERHRQQVDPTTIGLEPEAVVGIVSGEIVSRAEIRASFQLGDRDMTCNIALPENFEERQIFVAVRSCEFNAVLGVE